MATSPATSASARRSAGRLLCVTCYRRYLQLRKEHFDDEGRFRRWLFGAAVLSLLYFALRHLVAG